MKKGQIYNFAKRLEGKCLVNYMHDVMQEDIEDEDDGSGNGRTYEELIQHITDYIAKQELTWQEYTGELACLYNYSRGDRSRMSFKDWQIIQSEKFLITRKQRRVRRAIPNAD